MSSLIEPSEMFKRVKELGQPAIALTDTASLVGGWSALKAAKQTGVKLIIGEEFHFVDEFETKDRLRSLVLLAMNETGYQNLLELHKQSYDHFIVAFKKVHPRIDWNLLEKYNEGLTCLTGGGQGILAQLINNRKAEEAKVQAQRLQNIFGDRLGLEVQAHGLRRNITPYNSYEDQALVNRTLITWGEELGIKVVATAGARMIEKSQAEALDVALAIGSGQPVNSGARLKFNQEFYLKSREEMEGFFSRLYKEKAKEFCDNAVEFAERCEHAKWINPSLHRPKDVLWELPIFPVQDQPDYQEFLIWKNNEAPKLKEDDAYLRYTCYNKFPIKFKNIPIDRIAEYRSRMEKELKVMAYKGLSSYMLIVADFIDWARSKNIPTGCGRGCLGGDTLVLTGNGYQKLSEIQIGDKVYTHTGKLKEVLQTFKYNVEKEELIKITSEYSFNPIIMTTNHKIWGEKIKETEKYSKALAAGYKSYNSYKRWENSTYPAWHPINEMKIGDVIYTQIPNRKIDNSFKKIDMAEFVDDKTVIHSDYLERFIIGNESDSLGIKEIWRRTGISQNALRDIKHRSRKTLSKTFNKLINYLNNYNISLEEWMNYKVGRLEKLQRFINIDEEFVYMLGRWAGDGWFSPKGIAIAFNSEDVTGLNKVKCFFEKLGCYTNPIKHRTKKLIQLYIYNPTIKKLFKSLFQDYKDTSGTKHLPVIFRKFPNNLLQSLFEGLAASDGYHEKTRTSFDSTSLRLLLEVKEILLYLGQASYISTRKPWVHGKYLCNQSYKIRFNFTNKKKNFISDNLYFSRIKQLEFVKENFVYDIMVDEDHSYLTSNYVVHNSVSGCSLGYLLGIHDADPIQYGLIFERFYNMEKTGCSDIDSDISQAGKPLVEEYLAQKYGRANCAKVTNYMELTSKPYTKAISRAFMFGGDRKSAVRIGNEISAIIPDDVKKVKKLFEDIPLFTAYAESPQYQALGKFAPDLGNKFVARATHAAALIIASKPMHTIVPVRRDSDGTYSVEYDKDEAEANGLVKMDILGLSTLDIIQNTLNLIKSRNKPLPTLPWNYDENDSKTYDLIGSGDTYGVFQFGTSAGTVELCVEIQPKNIEELAMINALTRPGVPKEARKEFILTKKGKRKMQIMHPCLKRSLEPTLGFPLYDECLLTLATDVAGWDLNEADRLRKFVKEKGKNPEKDKKLQEDFVNGAIKNTKLQARTAQKIWDDVVGNFGKYAFNKSHAITYSFIAYQTAYLKAHYPLEFLLCNLSFESDSNTQKSEDNILQIKREIRAMGVNILPPDINKSEYTYTIIDDQTILTGFDSMKYMGKDAIPEIIKHRPFVSFQDFLSKVDHKKVKAPAIQALAASGALDSFNIPRKVMFLYSHDFKKKFAAWMKKDHKPDESFQYPFPELVEWNANEKAALELKYLGEMLTTDYRSVYPGFFSRKVVNFAELAIKYAEDERKNIELDAMDGNLEGMVSGFYEFKIKNPESKIYGQLMGKMMVQDLSGNSYNITFFPDALNNFKSRVVSLMGKKFVLEAGCSIALLGSVSWYKGKLGVNFNDLRKIGVVPPLPDNLTPQKVSMKIGGKKKKVAESSVEDILEEVNEELVEEGVNVEQEEIFDDIFEPEDLEFSDIDEEKD